MTVEQPYRQGVYLLNLINEVLYSKSRAKLPNLTQRIKGTSYVAEA
jgi:hypothetical protein